MDPAHVGFCSIAQDTILLSCCKILKITLNVYLTLMTICSCDAKQKHKYTFYHNTSNAEKLMLNMFGSNMFVSRANQSSL